MKATEKDVKEWWGATMGSDKFTTSGYRINALISFHNWMLNKQDRQPKPEPNMRKPELYNLYYDDAYYRLDSFLKNHQKNVMEYSGLLSDSKKRIEAIEYILAERANKIEVGDRYEDRHGNILSVVALDNKTSEAWCNSNSNNNTCSYRYLLETCTKLPKDEH